MVWENSVLINVMVGMSKDVSTFLYYIVISVDWTLIRLAERVAIAMRVYFGRFY